MPEVHVRSVERASANPFGEREGRGSIRKGGRPIQRCALRGYPSRGAQSDQLRRTLEVVTKDIEAASGPRTHEPALNQPPGFTRGQDVPCRANCSGVR
jgi:hypothetical protein